MTDFSEWIDLAGERFGGSVLFANDEFFAPKESLLKPEAPVFLPDEYTERGKWMDGWETRRRREPGHDHCLIRLGAAGLIHGLTVDTTHFKGNYPEACSVEGAYVEGYPRPEEIEQLPFEELLVRSALKGDQENFFSIEHDRLVNVLRLHIYPDGGVARLRVHGQPQVRLGSLPVGDGLVDLAAAQYGARALTCSDMFFGVRHNLIMPGEARHMGEGWETRRRRDDGNDWVLIQLCARGTIRRVEVDTRFFKGNAPARCLLEGTLADGVPGPDAKWQPLLEVPLRPHTQHLFIDEVELSEPVSHVRFHIFPCGGIARLRIHGEIDDTERARQGLSFLNRLPTAALERELFACCGSSRFARELAERRPFASPEALGQAADEVWAQAQEADWLEAFSAHPRIGERKAGRGRNARWSGREQSRAAAADPKVLARLAEANRRYEQKHNFVFLICATGKSAEEILASAERRLENDRSQELAEAAEQQRQITHLRLRRLLQT